MDTYPKPDARPDRMDHPDPAYLGDDPVEGTRSTFTLRDLLAIGFRHRRLVLLTVVATYALIALAVVLRPAEYESEMKILVKRERVDPLVTPDDSRSQPAWIGVTEEELNSEVELLRSRDLLTQVVAAERLHERRDRGLLTRVRQAVSVQAARPEESTEPARIAAAVDEFGRQLDVQTLRNSNVIQVGYASPDPDRAAAVLRTLAERYLEKHLAVHRPTGAFEFFDTETQRYQGQLRLAQATINEQSRDAGVASVQAAREIALQRLGELEATEQTTEAAIAETTARLGALEEQIAAIPERTVTEVHSGSGLLLEELHSTLVTYQLRRIELLRTFQPDYPLVQEVEAQIAAVEAAIAGARTSPLVEETTDRNPAFDLVQADLARSRAELAGLRARARAITDIRAAAGARARQLEEMGQTQEALVRVVAQAEQNYLTYARKREEARISNALDDQRILNVAIAEAATVPFEPSGPSTPLLLLCGLLVAGGAGVGLAWVVDYLDPSFRTPDEVRALVGIPVLASMPRLPVPERRA